MDRAWKIVLAFWFLLPVLTVGDLWLVKNLGSYPLENPLFNLLSKNAIEVGLFTAGVWLGKNV